MMGVCWACHKYIHFGGRIIVGEQSLARFGDTGFGMPEIWCDYLERTPAEPWKHLRRCIDPAPVDPTPISTEEALDLKKNSILLELKPPPSVWIEKSEPRFGKYMPLEKVFCLQCGGLLQSGRFISCKCPGTCDCCGGECFGIRCVPCDITRSKRAFGEDTQGRQL
jgi:hypothetical protein